MAPQLPDVATPVALPEDLPACPLIRWQEPRLSLRALRRFAWRHVLRYFAIGLLVVAVLLALSAGRWAVGFLEQFLTAIVDGIDWVAGAS